MVSTAGTVTSGGWAPAPAGPTVTLAGPSAGGLGLPEPDSAGGPWNHGCTSGGPQRTDRPSRSPSEVPSRRRLGRLGPGGHRGRISACNAATGIPSLRAATVLTRPDRLARRLLRGSVRGPPLSPQPARLGLAESESLALAAGLPAGPAAAGANRAKSDNPGDDDP
jgi:hypothetical protein